MLVRQQKLQVESFGINPKVWPSGEERGDYVTWNVTALIHELVEAMNEIAWKPWATDKTTFNRDAYLKELVDAMHFLFNLILVAQKGLQDEYDIALEVFNLYFAKAQVNADRQASGTYDGWSTKCADCGRAIEDGIRRGYADEVEAVDGSVTLQRQAYACVCGRVNYIEVRP